MAQEPKPSPALPGQKRPWDTAISCPPVLVCPGPQRAACFLHRALIPRPRTRTWTPQRQRGALLVEILGIPRKSCIPQLLQIKLPSAQGLWPWPIPIYLCHSRNYDLDYELYREDIPYSRVYEYQRIPPLINGVPIKIRRTHVGTGLRSNFSPHKAPRNSHLPPGQIKLQTEELHSIRGELSQIKAQVDRLLESVERMDQQRDRLPGEESYIRSGRLPVEGWKHPHTTHPCPARLLSSRHLPEDSFLDLSGFSKASRWHPCNPFWGKGNEVEAQLCQTSQEASPKCWL
ncbi:uncharacterized protein LOC116666091 [Camelus ferus]|uniref:Uncharacterized protein LOC116666091 n=1 Tax=Camelus ferus TaxID=419612 RepID=A0A8B8TPX2_CAMFR|nr:uncharacterized protein LOC116666091 [Camelus ferus]